MVFFQNIFISMMKKILATFLVLALGQVLTACFIDFDELDCERGSGRISSEFYQMRSFERLSVSGDFEVYVTQDASTEVELSADDNLIDEVDMYVSGGTLFIGTKECIRPSSTMRIYIQNAVFSRIELSGSGKIISQNQIVSRNLDLFCSGSGSMDFSLDTQNLKTNISGSGQIYAEGLAQNQDVNISGSGSYDAFGLDSQNCSVNLSGSGRANVWVYSELQATISGSGRIYYKGRPRLRTNISGSGSVISSN